MKLASSVPLVVERMLCIQVEMMFWLYYYLWH